MLFRPKAYETNIKTDNSSAQVICGISHHDSEKKAEFVHRLLFGCGLFFIIILKIN